MKTKNYLTVTKNNMLELHGFDEIKEYFYVEIFAEKKYLLFITNERMEKDTCFKVCLGPERTVDDERLLKLVTTFGLVSKRFLKDNHFKNYLSSDIEV